MEKEMDQSTMKPPPEVVRGDTTPARSSSVNVAMNEADKRLEAMGYTPVRCYHSFLFVITWD